MRSTIRIIACAALLPFLAACSVAKEQPPASEQTASVASKPPTMEEMHAAFKKASTPTAQHALLKDMTGEWKATSTMWMDPSGQPEVTVGQSKKTMTLGGRFLREDFVGTFMKIPFKGIGMTGFDTVTNEFSTMWVDSMSTAMMTSSGTSDGSGKTIAFGGSMSCPMTNGKVPVRSVLRIDDKNHHSFEMFTPGPDGKETKAFEIAYVRVK